jgi:hypothetical protein
MQNQNGAASFLNRPVDPSQPAGSMLGLGIRIRYDDISFLKWLRAIVPVGHFTGFSMSLSRNSGKQAHGLSVSVVDDLDGEIHCGEFCRLFHVHADLVFKYFTHTHSFISAASDPGDRSVVIRSGFYPGDSGKNGFSPSSVSGGTMMLYSTDADFNIRFHEVIIEPDSVL